MNTDNPGMPATTKPDIYESAAPGPTRDRTDPPATPEQSGVQRHDHDGARVRADAEDDGAGDEPFPNPGPVSAAVLWLIRGYQRFLSPTLPPACRFVPSCSQYGYEAIAKYGIIKGGRLAAWRILRCNPFGGKGYDPVP